MAGVWQCDLDALAPASRRSSQAGGAGGGTVHFGQLKSCTVKASTITMSPATEPRSRTATPFVRNTSRSSFAARYRAGVCPCFCVIAQHPPSTRQIAPRPSRIGHHPFSFRRYPLLDAIVGPLSKGCGVRPSGRSDQHPPSASPAFIMAAARMLSRAIAESLFLRTRRSRCTPPRDSVAIARVRGSAWSCRSRTGRWGCRPGPGKRTSVLPWRA